MIAIIIILIGAVAIFNIGRSNNSNNNNELNSNLNNNISTHCNEEDDLIDEMDRQNQERFIQECMDESRKIITPFSEGGYDLTHDMNNDMHNDMNNFDMF